METALLKDAPFLIDELSLAELRVQVCHHLVSVGIRFTEHITHYMWMTDIQYTKYDILTSNILYLESAPRVLVSVQLFGISPAWLLESHR